MIDKQTALFASTLQWLQNTKLGKIIGLRDNCFCALNKGPLIYYSRNLKGGVGLPQMSAQYKLNLTYDAIFR